MSLSKATIPSPNSFISNKPIVPDFKESSLSDASTEIDMLCAESPVSNRIVNNNDSDGVLRSPIVKKMERRSIYGDRTSCVKFYRNRSKMRRTHSMFQKSQEVVDSEVNDKNTRKTSSSCLDNNDHQNHSQTDGPISFLDRDDCPIDHFTIESDPLKRIDGDTLCDILDGKFNHLYSKHIIIDCRFEYEYRGGHIDSAINISEHSKLEKILFQRQHYKSPPLLIFHCEFSSHRGPLMAVHLRKCDRNLNVGNYPHLNYPNILILQGGYKTFFKNWSFRCFPQKYVEMNDEQHSKTCEKEMDRFRKSSKLNRAQSYTYGIGSSSSTNINYSQLGFNSNTNGITNKSPKTDKFGSSGLIRNSYLNSQLNSQLDFSFKFPKYESLKSNQKTSLKPAFTKYSLSLPLLKSKYINTNADWELEDFADGDVTMGDENGEDSLNTTPTIGRKRFRVLNQTNTGQLGRTIIDPIIF